jgi:hypothetical protein
MDNQVLYNPASCRSYSMIALVNPRDQCLLQYVYNNALVAELNLDF